MVRRRDPGPAGSGHVFGYGEGAEKNYSAGNLSLNRIPELSDKYTRQASIQLDMLQYGGFMF